MHFGSPDDIEQITQRTGTNGIAWIGEAQGSGQCVRTRRHRELPEFLGQRHGTDQGVYAAHARRTRTSGGAKRRPPRISFLGGANGKVSSTGTMWCSRAGKTS